MTNYTFSLFITLIIFITKLNAGIIYVSATGSDEEGDGSTENPFETIQKGVDIAIDMDTVYVSNGIYEGGIVISNKVISLIGESREETKINQPISSPQISIIECEAGTTRVENFIIKHGSSNNGGGIFSSESNIEVENIDFSNNSSSNNGAAINSIESTVKVQNSTFSLNICNSLGGAIYVDPLTTCEIYNSSFTNNGAWNGGAIATIGGGKLLIQGCSISNNNAVGYNPNPDEDYPTYGGGGGIYQEWSDSLEIYDTEIINNTAVNAPGGGIAIYLSNDIIIDNIILSNNSSLGGGGGVMFLRTDNVLFENSTIANNISSGNSGGGIFIGSESGLESIVIHATFNRLSIFNNHAMSGGAIFCWSTILNLYNSTLAQNEATNSDWSGGGLASHYVTEPNIINSLFYDNIPNSIHNGYQQTPVLVAYSLTQEWWAGWGNLIDIDPLFMDPENEDFTLQSSSPCFDAGTADIDGDGFQDITDYFGTAPDMGAFEFCEGGTYIDDCGTCDGDNSVCTGCTDPQALNFDAENIFADESCLYTIEQDIWVSTSGDDSLNTGLDANSPFKTITNALWRIAQSVGTPYTIHLSEGVYSPSATGESFPIILKSYVNISGSGEAVTIIDAEEMSRVMNIIGNESIIISDMTITGGFADDLTSGLNGGAILAEFSNFTLDNVTISGNMAEDYGGGIYMEESSPTFTDLTISDNMSNDDGAGMYLKYSDPTMTDVIISGNTANDHAGGIQLLYSNPTMTNVAISDNTADDDGGGMYLRYSNPIMTNVTISGNTANDDSGCMYLNRSSPTLKNSIIWNNAPPSITISGDETPIISYSDIEGGWEGEGNIDTDPLFCNPGSGDYRLNEESPCIATGENGENMGALAVGCEAILSTDKDVVLPSQFVLYQNYPNPFNPVTTLRYDLPEDANVNITIYDMMGRQVSTLVSSHQSAGYKSLQWNATNDKGATVSAGLYLYTIQTDDFMQTKKMMLLK